MNKRPMAMSAACALACMGAMAHTNAATSSKNMIANPAGVCQLSIPTTDSRVRPKATAYNNEGATTAFVICGLTNPASVDGGASIVFLGARSLDGATHGLTCTAVNGVSGVDTQQYVPKTITVPATGYGEIDWVPADFGGSTTIPGSRTMSVTCTLPPDVGINAFGQNYLFDIGS